MSATAYTTSAPSSSRLGPHRKHRKQDPCPVCGGTTSYCVTFVDGATICGKTPSDHPAGLGFMHWPHGRPDDWQERLAQVPPPPPRPVADVVTLDRAYRALLSCCPLSDDDRAGLHARGLTDAEIAGSFGTMPDDPRARARIVAAVTDAIGRDPAGVVPGFLATKGRTQLVTMPGLLVAGWTADGLLGSIQVRVKHPGEGGKYRHLSAGDVPGSMGADGHFVNVSRPQRPVSTRVVVVTEGSIKGLVTATRLGRVTASVAGVSNTGKLVATLQHLGDVEEVWMAYDDDRTTNMHVAAAETKTARELQAAGYEVKQLVWPAEFGKGLDDALQAGVIPVAIAHPALTQPQHETASENHENMEESRRQHALTQAAHRAPNLGTERHTLTDFATMLASYPEGEWVPAPYAKVADQAGVESSTAERHLSKAGIRPKAGEAGILAGLVEVKLDKVPERVNEHTGQVSGGYDAMHVRRLAPLPELLQRIATAPPSAKGKRNGHGGRREPCWKCGATDIKRTITDRCVCGELIQQTTRTITGDEEPPPPQVAVTPPASDDAHPGPQVAVDPSAEETAPDICSSTDTVYRGHNLRSTPPTASCGPPPDRLERARLHLTSLQERTAGAAPPDDDGAAADTYEAQEMLQFADYDIPPDPWAEYAPEAS